MTNTGNSIRFDLPLPVWQAIQQDSDRGAGLDKNKPPLHEFRQIFESIASRALKLGFRKVLNKLGNKEIRVATMCSGTDAPVLAIRSIDTGLLFHYLLSDSD